MGAYKTRTQPTQGWRAKLMPAVGWALLTLFAVLVLNWTIRSLAPDAQPATAETPEPEISFADRVRQGDICSDPLALAHGFAVFLTNGDKTGFVMLDQEQTIGEIRSFAWSPDGAQLAIFGNTTGSGNIYLTNADGQSLQPVLRNPELGYLRDAAWSRDGNQFVIWSTQNNSVIYLVNANGTGLVERELDAQIFSAPQFAPDNQSIIFYGADAVADGLFNFTLDGSQTRLVSDLVEDESGFAFSPDGSHLAYMEMDREVGEARLVAEEISTGNLTVLGTLPIPQGAGSSIPESANLSWSQDGKSLVFDFGRNATNRAAYLSYADGTGLVKVADSAYAPTTSADGKCLAYISNQRVFLLDLTTPLTGTAVLLADLPTGRGMPDFRLDKLQWRPATNP